MFDPIAISPFQGLTFDQLRNDYPWLLSILESHRRQCNPDSLFSEAFELSRLPTHKEDFCCLECHKRVANLWEDEKSSQGVGVIGFGNFGKFLAIHLARAFHNVTVSDVAQQHKEAAELGLRWASLEETASKEIVVLAIPFQNLQQLLKQVSDFFQQNALVVDVCSVKQAPLKLMMEYLPSSVEIVGTHPLFGPQSAKEGLQGHRIVVCPKRVSEQRGAKIQALLSYGFGLQTFERDPKVHDQEMAMVQALTHFVAQGLSGCGIKKSELTTVAFSKLCEVVELLGGDSWELFQTIENGNPFGSEIRRQFIQELLLLEQKLAS